jgi:hypothetical protein
MIWLGEGAWHYITPSPPVTFAIRTSYCAPHHKICDARQEGMVAPIRRPPLISKPPCIVWSPKLAKGSPAPPPHALAVLPCPRFFAVWQWSVYVKPITEYAANHMKIYLGSLVMCPLLNMSSGIPRTANLAYCRREGMYIHLNYH